MPAKPQTPLVTGLLGFIGLLLLWAPAPQGLLAILSAIGGFLTALFFILMFLQYGTELAQQPLRHTAIVYFASFGLSFLDNAALLVPLWLKFIFCALGPALCTICLHLASTAKPNTEERRGDGIPSASTLTVLTVLFIIFCISGNLVRGLTNPWFNYNGPTYRTAVMTGINLFIVVVSIVALRRGKSIDRTLFANWIVYMLLFVGGLMLLTLPASTELNLVGSDLITASRVGFTLVIALFALELYAAKDATRLIRATTVLLFLPEAFSAVVRYIAVPYVLQTIDVEPLALASWICIGIAFALVFATTIVLGQLLLKREGTAGPAALDHPEQLAEPSRQDRMDQVFGALATTCGLTTREVETASYVARGYSFEKTAALLGISINTVRTHMRGAYGKLNVHSRQELIDLLDTEVAQASSKLSPN